ncbi:hypothetical protein TNCV_4126761 [Trichonephila clavipes]|uniref:Uncharacterized protein n=1 Tax=Trichonephila clavipes TaxID=2585209 RepID=A0A8X6SSP0_TRICX|nr:hypothetical protein TNCV_4126761 [Trichonephila clavipes]
MANEIDWNGFSKKTLTEDILRGLSDVVNWHYVFQYSPLSEAFIEEYATEEDWPIISHFQKLSDPFMQKHEEDLE